jgi:hypothetical protein
VSANSVVFLAEIEQVPLLAVTGISADFVKVKRRRKKSCGTVLVVFYGGSEF